MQNINKGVRMYRNLIKFSIFFGMFLFLAQAKGVRASNFEVSPAANIDYGTGVGKKLGRGISNIAFGWLELPKGIQDIGDQNNFIAGITWGPIYGLGKAVVRTVAGAYEVVSFPVPVPPNFEPLIRPEFMLGDSQ